MLYLLSVYRVAAATPAASQDKGVQIPSNIQQEIAATNDKFNQILEEECPTQGCFAVGCSVSRFGAADQVQGSSLPGLEETKLDGKPQYRLEAVLCEFAYEPSIDPAELANLKQRVRQRVKNVGVELSIGTRPLTPKVDLDSKGSPKTDSPPLPPPTILDQFVLRLIPFVPWFLLLILSTLVLLLILWGWRRVGRVEKRSSSARTREMDRNLPAPLEPEPSPHMLMRRVAQLSHSLGEDPHLVEVTLKKYFEEKNYDELIHFVRHFGPELLSPFKIKPEFREALGVLSQKYSETDAGDAPSEIWGFLNRIERDMIAAKVRIDVEPLAENFQFLSTLGVDEFLGILREISEEEAIAAVSYAPRRLREQFFASANPTFTAKFVEHLTKVEKMSDSFVRDVAKKLREVHQVKGDSLRVVRRDTIPLFEEALNALDPDKRRQLLKDLSQANPAFLKSVAPVVFLDDSLPLLSDPILAEAMMLVTPEEASHYLAGFTWAPQVLGRLNPRLAEAIRKARFGNQVDSQIAWNAREKIAVFVKQQHLLGALDLIAINARLAKE